MLRRSPRPPVRWRPRPAKVAALGAAAFVGLFGFLGARVAIGDDPALSRAPKPTEHEDHGPSLVTAVESVANVFADEDDDEAEGDESSSGDGASRSADQNPSTGTSGG
jgi:hypothetical protein